MITQDKRSKSEIKINGPNQKCNIVFKIRNLLSDQRGIIIITWMRRHIKINAIWRQKFVLVSRHYSQKIL